MDQTERRFEIHIKQHADDATIKVLGEGGVSERRADKIADGVSINLNHEAFYVDLVEVASAAT